MTTSASDELESLRPYLLRYALLQLRDHDLAEDAVQETLLAAFEGQARFAGKSSHKTWLTGILKHKIVDVMRRRSREQPLAEDDPDAIDALFTRNGHWQQFPADWGDPHKALEDQRFRSALEMCVQLMPARNARAFMMREVMELDSDEICKELSITPTNLWVMLHRARLSLRECLEIKWFGTPREK